MAGDHVKNNDRTGMPRLEWQSEFDRSMADIDSRLRHSRRRATDVGPQSTLPGVSQVNLSSELLDEIAWRVAEQMRRHTLAFPPAPPADVRPAPPPVNDVGLRHGKMLLIRFRMPRLPWPLRLLQRRRHRLP